MTYLLVVYILMNGAWVRGDELDGWGSIAYATEAQCLESKTRADAIQSDLKRVNPRAFDKRFVCQPQHPDKAAAPGQP